MNKFNQIIMMDTNGKSHVVTLTSKELHKLQTQESKRTLKMGLGTLALSLCGRFVSNDKAKIALNACAFLGAIATNVSMLDTINKCDSPKAIDDCNAVLREIARSRGFEAVL